MSFAITKLEFKLWFDEFVSVLGLTVLRFKKEKCFETTKLGIKF